MEVTHWPINSCLATVDKLRVIIIMLKRAYIGALAYKNSAFPPIWSITLRDQVSFNVSLVISARFRIAIGVAILANGRLI